MTELRLKELYDRVVKSTSLPSYKLFRRNDTNFIKFIEEIDFQGELGWAKLRYQLLKEAQDDAGIGDEIEEDDMELTEEEKERFEVLEGTEQAVLQSRREEIQL